MVHRRGKSNDSPTPGYALEISGENLLDVLSKRLNRAGGKEKLLLLEQPPARFDVIDARSRGYRVVSRSLFSIFRLMPRIPAILRHPYVVFLDLHYPFVDPALVKGMIARMEREGLWLLENRQRNLLAPMAIVTRPALVLGVVHKLWTRLPGWFEAIQSVAGPKRQGATAFPQSALAPCLTADTVQPELIEALGGHDFSSEEAISREKSSPDLLYRAFELSQKRLYDEMQGSCQPHLANLKLLNFESRNGLTDVKSFPYDIAFNISTLCNARCQFCNYRTIKPELGVFITLADFKRMTFLKYAGKVGLGGDLGDPLMNPEFPEIFRYLRETHPHLVLRIITNGIGLNDRLCADLVGNLARIRISLNAATRQTWEDLMGVKGFDRVCQQVGLLAEMKKKQGLTEPEIILLMVVNRKKINQTVAFVELAHTLGADAVNFSHFMPYVMPGCTLPRNASLYYEPALFDEWMNRAAQRATELGIRIFDRPPDFKCRDVVIFEGIRELKAPEKCYLPWYQCFFVHGRRSREREMHFCCVGVDTGIGFVPTELDEAHFIQLWNHERMKQVRRTVNAAHKNPVCQSCRSVDKADPEYGGEDLGIWDQEMETNRQVPGKDAGDKGETISHEYYINRR